jgi:hypothetical protein
MWNDLEPQHCSCFVLGMPDEPEPLTVAEMADVISSLHYALRFDERGKPRGVKMRVDDLATAEWLARHLRMSRYVVMRRPPLAKHSAP